MHFAVTKDDIRRAISARERGESTARTCIIAQTLKRVTGIDWVVVKNRAWTPEVQGRVTLPSEVKAAIELFDNERPVAPFEFDLPVEPLLAKVPA